MTAPSAWALELAVVAFAGGAFGAAIGALPSFALTGAAVVAGELLALARPGSGPNLTGAVGFGPVLGPHVAFGGGAAALAYAVRRDRVDAAAFGGADGPHPAKGVERGLGTAPDVLAVGGAFGVFGHYVATAAGAVGVPTDPVALAVVASALAHRLAFGYPLVGRPAAGIGWLDVSPGTTAGPDAAPDGGDAGGGVGVADGAGTERDPHAGNGVEDGGGPGDDTDDATVGGGPDVGDDADAGDDADGPDEGAATEGTPGDVRSPVEPWLAHQYRWRDVAGVGLAGGVLGAYLAYLTASPFLAFGLSAASLAFLTAGVAAVPVTHHVTLPASTAALALSDPATPLTPAAVAGGVALPTALAAGALAGLAGALAGELLERLLYAHADTHLDPPAASIVVTAAALTALATLGVLPSAVWLPTP